MTSTTPAFGDATIEDCEREAIHIPGSIQPHAALLVARAGIVVHHSENASELLGTAFSSPNGTLVGELFDAPTLSVIEGLANDGLRRRTARIDIDERTLDVTRSEAPGDLHCYQFEPVDGTADLADSFQEAVTQATVRMQTATTSAAVVDELCAVVKKLTGFDRVMGYRFEPDDHGVVVAEHRREDLAPYLGLHYPASDIPAQAREMYLAHWLRLIPDASYRPVPIVPTLTPGSEAPLDMSDIDARSVSPIHCEYLVNMGVRASMSISLVVDNRLWGLIACHHYASDRRPSVPVREACEFVALSGSMVLASRLAEERVAADLASESLLHRLAEQLLLADDLAEGLTSEPSLLLDLLDADGAAVALGRRIRSIGSTPPDDVIVALGEHLASAAPGEITSSDAAAAAAPVLADHAETASGFVALPLSSLQRNYLFWFRSEWKHSVTWGGEPAKAIVVRADGSQRLAPRASFDEWIENIRGRSRPWEESGLGAVEMLRSLIGTHITRAVEQLARVNAELTRSNAELDAFAYVAAHDLKEPLRGMANYAAFLAEDYSDALDPEGREQLDMMIRLSDRMTGLLSSLLDYARVGRSDLRRSDVQLADVLDDTLTLLGGRIEESGATVSLLNDVPVNCDPDLLGQVLMNLISNGIKYNESDTPLIEVGSVPLSTVPTPLDSLGSSVLAEEDQNVIFVRDNGIGIKPELTKEVFRVFRRLHRPDEYGGGAGAGLTIARRIVKRHGGDLWLDSEPGEGTTFYFTLGTA